MRRIAYKTGTIIVAVATMISVVVAGAPGIISFQGKLTDSDGNPVISAVDVTFRIWDAESGGTLIWEDTYPVTPDQEGLFTILLGDDIPNPLDDIVFENPNLWLGVQVEEDAELTPRARIASAAFAQRISTVDGASGGTIGGDLAVDGAIDVTGVESKVRFFYSTLGDLPSASTYHGMFAHVHGEGRAYYAHAGQWVPITDENNPPTITSSEIQNGTILFEDVNQNGASEGQVMKWDGIGWTVSNDETGSGGDSDWIISGIDMYSGVSGNVGIGTTSPSEKLDVNGDIVVGGKARIGSANSNSGTAAFVAGQGNSANANFAAVGGGTSNTASGANAVISGGNSNNATAPFSAIGGGLTNFATGDKASVGGGEINIAEGQYSAIAGGKNNRARGLYSVVAGGGGSLTADSNAANGNYSSVGGGNRTIATGEASTVSGGQLNEASGQVATIGGGYSNDASQIAATIAGGYQNNASGYYATIGGGHSNVASGAFATIPGGQFNQATGDFSLAAGFRANAQHVGSIVLSDNSNTSNFNSSANNQFSVRSAGGARIYSSSNLSTGVTLAAGGGSWASVSDINVKRNIRPVDGKKILEKLDRLSISRWSYKTQDPDIEHIGPMAQDFYAAFGVGEDNRFITAIDADGVALAAIKSLYRITQKQDTEIDALKSELSELKGLIRTINATHHNVGDNEDAVKYSDVK